MEDPYIAIGSFDRKNLYYGAKSINRGPLFVDELVAQISKYARNFESTIVYCTTVKDVQEVSFHILITFSSCFTFVCLVVDIHFLFILPRQIVSLSTSHNHDYSVIKHITKSFLLSSLCVLYHGFNALSIFID